MRRHRLSSDVGHPPAGEDHDGPRRPTRAAVDSHITLVGVWGPGIFSDDTAADIRGDYRELLEDQVPDVEATRRVVEACRHLDADEEHVLWLALAASQSQVGRLEEVVKARAVGVIDEGVGLERWEEAGPKELAKRKAALARLRNQLTGPQRPRKAVRRPWRHETDLQAGDVLSLAAGNGEMALLRVLRIDDHRLGAAPIAAWLDWQGRALPAESRLSRTKARRGTGSPGRPRRPATYRVARHRKKDADWRDAGFALGAGAASPRGCRGGGLDVHRLAAAESRARAQSDGVGRRRYSSTTLLKPP